jgi:hypothetical protein
MKLLSMQDEVWFGTNRDTMPRTVTSCVLFLLIAASLSAQELSTPVRDCWSFNTAYLMPGGKWESGIAQPFRLGLNPKVEIHSNALELPFLPNLGVKMAQGSRNGFVFATDHVLSYPTTFLQIASRRDIGGIISPEFGFSSILSVTNSLLASKVIGSSSILSAYGGFAFAIRSSKPDPQSTIDLPLLYPRMAHWYEGTSIRLGMAFKGSFSKKLFYEEVIRTFIITRPQNNFFAENAGTIMWAAGRSIRIRGGYTLSYGKYPFGTHWQLWPSLDLVFGSKR